MEIQNTSVRLVPAVPEDEPASIRLGKSSSRRPEAQFFYEWDYKALEIQSDREEEMSDIQEEDRYSKEISLRYITYICLQSCVYR